MRRNGDTDLVSAVSRNFGDVYFGLQVTPPVPELVGLEGVEREVYDELVGVVRRVKVGIRVFRLLWFTVVV